MYPRFFLNLEDDKDSLDGGVSINIVLAMENINGLSELAVRVQDVDDPSSNSSSPRTIIGPTEVRQYEASLRKVVQLFLRAVDFDIPLFPYIKETCFQLPFPGPAAPNHWVARYWRVLRELAVITLSMRYFLAHGVVQTWEGFSNFPALFDMLIESFERSPVPDDMQIEVLSLIWSSISRSRDEWFLKNHFNRRGLPASYVLDYQRTLKPLTMEEIVLTTLPRSPQSRKTL